MTTNPQNAMRDLGLGPFEAREEDGAAYVLSGENVLCECAKLKEAEVMAEVLTDVFEHGSAGDLQEKHEEEIAEKDADIESLSDDVESLADDVLAAEEKVTDLELEVAKLRKKLDGSK